MAKNRQPPRHVRRPLKPQGTCIFCGSIGLTKEHVWADWLGNELLPRTEQSHIQEKIKLGFDRKKLEPVLIPDVKTYQGDLGSRKVRVVCGVCNGGWMSRLQKAAKPILTSLISGELRGFLPGESEILASWLTMTTMVFEYTDPSTIAVSTEERRIFKNTVQPLSGWSISVGRYSGENWGPKRLLHNGLQVLISENLRPPPQLGAGCNSQSTTIVAGRMVAHIMSSQTNWLIPKTTRFLDRNMHVIYPDPGSLHDLRGREILGDEVVDALSILILRGIREVADAPVGI